MRLVEFACFQVSYLEQLALENDPVARRKAARERELQADMENARGLFGDDAVDAVAPPQGNSSPLR